VQKEAALLGYHVIGLMYVNGGPRLAIAGAPWSMALLNP
jgi:hypothetical protein